MASFEITWQAPEFEFREKGVSWYWISVFIAAAIIAFAIWQRNFLFGGFIVIAEILFVSWGNVRPATIDFTLTDLRLEIGTAKFYSLKEFQNYSTNKMDDEWTEVFFSFKSKIRMPLMIIVPNGKMDEIRANLKPLLRETDFEPSLLDALEKIIRF
jgi:hypothetical protein